MTEAELSFNRAARSATRECKRLGYDPTYTVQLMTEPGSLGAARQMLERAAACIGFTRLLLQGRLDLSVEAMALRAEFRDLFSPSYRDQRSQITSIYCVLNM